MNTRPVSVIASEAIADMEKQAKAKGKYWRQMFPYACQQADAMLSLNSIDDNYMFDSGRMVVGSFLSNVSSWKGETARALKKELRTMMGLK